MQLSPSGNFNIGGGSNVFGITDAVTPPSGAITGGGVLYSTAGDLCWSNSAGNTARIGGYIGSETAYMALYLGTTPSSTNAVIYTDAGNTQSWMNCPAVSGGVVGWSFGGSVVPLKASRNTTEVGVGPGYNLSVGSLTGSYGGGVGGCIALLKATTSPTTAITNGGVVYVDTATGNLMFIGTSGVARLVALA